ncbi:MAG: hypothetical protein CMO55_25245 [Verrucomicrobiales bacterium]|nr:hypothetical protein [Verrucomicrobiales bacterium]
MFRIAIISSVPPDPNRIAGALILCRWLDHPQIDWTYLEPPAKPKSLFWHGLERLSRTRLHRVFGPVKLFYEQNKLAVYLRNNAFFRYCAKNVREHAPDTILSIAHGPFYKIAHRVSKYTGTPLILLAQDWWPAFPKVNPKYREKEERDFISICGDSDATIAVSEGMFEALGKPENTEVLHDLPSEVSQDVVQTFEASAHPLRIIYAGNISTYGPMVEQAARSCMDSTSVRLEIYGREPIRWSEGTEEQFRRDGIYRGFVSPGDFPKVAADYDFVLAIMSFAPELRQRMRTCFLSKIIELAQLGKPIVIWGPEDGSAAVWARKSAAALCVTDESPEALRVALEHLANDKDEQVRLANAIKESAANEFNPLKIRQKFMSILKRVVASK